MFEGAYEIAANIVQNEDYLIAAEAFANLQSAPADFRRTVLGQ